MTPIPVGIVASGVENWKPSDLSNLALWVDADNPGSFTYSSGTVVSQWNDLSGNSRHLSQSDTGKQPSRSGTQNGRPVVVFDGSDDLLANTGSTSWGSSYTIALVATPSSGTDDYLCMLRGAAPQQSAIITKYGSKSYETYNYNNSVTGRATLGNAGATGWHTLIVVRSGSAITSLVDGSASGSATYNTDTHTGGFILGASDLGGNAAASIAELVVTVSALSGSDLTNLSNYLRAKWGTP